MSEGARSALLGRFGDNAGLLRRIGLAANLRGEQGIFLLARN